MEIKSKWKRYAYSFFVSEDDLGDANITEVFDALMRCSTDDDVEVVMDSYSIVWWFPFDGFGHMGIVQQMSDMAGNLQLTEAQG